MPISQQEYRRRASQLLALDFEDATPRIIDFIEWLGRDPEAAAALQELRDHDIKALIEAAGFNRPPKAKGPEDVAAVGLCIIDNAIDKKTDLFRVGMALGIRGEGSKIQAHTDEISKRFMRPLYQYIETQLFETKQPLDPAGTMSQPANPKDIWVVHGRNERLRLSMFRFLRALGLNPIEWEEALARTKQGAPYIGNVLDAAFAQAGAVVVLLTPDDEVRLDPRFWKLSDGAEEKEFTGQARPNVLFEAGMALPDIRKGQFSFRLDQCDPLVTWPVVISFTSQTICVRVKLGEPVAVDRLPPVNQTGTDWQNEGDFEFEPMDGIQPLTALHRAAPRLSEEATELLRAAASDPTGEIFRMETADGLSIQTNGRSFVDSGNPRSHATWEAVLSELEREN